MTDPERRPYDPDQTYEDQTYEDRTYEDRPYDDRTYRLDPVYDDDRGYHADPTYGTPYESIESDVETRRGVAGGSQGAPPPRSGAPRTGAGPGAGGSGPRGPGPGGSGPGGSGPGGSGPGGYGPGGSGPGGSDPNGPDPNGPDPGNPSAGRWSPNGSGPSAPEPRPRWRFRLPTWRPSQRQITICALAIMALADAYIFWNTLVSKIQRDTGWLLVLVLALSVGAVSLCHEVGRMARERNRSAYRSLVWIGFLILLWLTMGLIIAYIRSHTPLDASDVSDGINTLDPTTPATADPTTSFSIDNPAVQLTALMLVLYLSTGSLAMAYGYRFGDPRTKAQRAIVQAREELVAKIQKLKDDRLLAEHGYLESGDPFPPEEP